MTCFIAAIQEVATLRTEQNIVPIQTGDVPTRRGSTEPAHTLIKYKPHTDMRKGILNIVAQHCGYYLRNEPYTSYQAPLVNHQCQDNSPKNNRGNGYRDEPNSWVVILENLHSLIHTSTWSHSFILVLHTSCVAPLVNKFMNGGTFKTALCAWKSQLKARAR